MTDEKATPAVPTYEKVAFYDARFASTAICTLAGAYAAGHTDPNTLIAMLNGLLQASYPGDDLQMRKGELLDLLRMGQPPR